jgi:hypothetical protein
MRISQINLLEAIPQLGGEGLDIFDLLIGDDGRDSSPCDSGSVHHMVQPTQRFGEPSAFPCYDTLIHSVMNYPD